MPQITSSTDPGSWLKRISHGATGARSDTGTRCLGVSVRVNSSRLEMTVTGKVNLAWHQPSARSHDHRAHPTVHYDNGPSRPRQSVDTTSSSAPVTNLEINRATSQNRTTNDRNHPVRGVEPPLPKICSRTRVHFMVIGSLGVFRAAGLHHDTRSKSEPRQGAVGERSDTSARRFRECHRDCIPERPNLPQD